MIYIHIPHVVAIKLCICFKIKIYMHVYLIIIYVIYNYYVSCINIFDDPIYLLNILSILDV